ncbi:AraC family transcriptional regulator [Granulicella sp. dw_53]|uniref:AraC family transcriptional regulator n=1 Tax=Granulicella sp. dw_53 TaxID=2719792 RepID=UPI001BD565DC|nr:AraC family transcriptional regulator [Granulicella sp. dw_53]
MDEAIRVPSFWNLFSEGMYLKDIPSAKLSLSPLSPLFGRVRADEGLPEISHGSGGPSGYMVAVQLNPIPFIEQFLGPQKVSNGFYPIGGVSLLNLQERPAIALRNSFDTLVLHVTQAALDEVAYAHRMPRAKPLARTFGHFDPVVHNLGQVLVSSLAQPHHVSKIFLDHILHALNCHFVSSYGGVTISAPKFEGGLSFLQMRRATELLEAHLDGNIALKQVAAACELSVSHFSRAFKQTFRRPPYKWLTELRVDRARDLMTNSRLPLADIAIQCGFADQSALNRSFKRIQGVTPGVWRRGMTRGPQRFK